MKKGLLITGGIIVVAIGGFVIYRKMKIKKAIKQAEKEGFTCGGCADKEITCTSVDGKTGKKISCGVFKFG
jgi:hypothetical protein